MKLTIMVGINLIMGHTFAYDALDRYSLLEDKFKTEEMLRPFGHDFLFDVTVHANKNLLDFVDDISDAGSTVNEVGEVLMQYDRTEQTVHANLNIGVPIFGFSIGNIAFDPNVRIGLRFGSNIGLRSEPLNIDTILQLVGNQIPPLLRDTISTLSFNPGDDIMVRVCNARGIPLAACPDTGRYFYPTLTNLPLIATYTKLDTKAGLSIPYKSRRYWFGDINFYGIFRSDFKLLMSADQIARGQNPFEEIGEDVKKQTFLMADYKLGYRKSRYKFFFSIEELKVARLSENIAEAGDLSYETPPLLRFHLNATYRPGVFVIRPFAGVHKRKYYDYKNGAYVGLDAGTYVFNDFLGLLFRLMADQEHLSFSSRFKITFFHLEYFLKTPFKDEIDNVRISTLHSINLRFSI